MSNRVRSEFNSGNGFQESYDEERKSITENGSSVNNDNYFEEDPFASKDFTTVELILLKDAIEAKNGVRVLEIVVDNPLIYELPSYFVFSLYFALEYENQDLFKFLKENSQHLIP